MTTFARISLGTVTDVCVGPDVATAVDQTFALGYVQSVGGHAAWVSVPDGTLPGSTSNGQGGYTPPAPTTVSTPKLMTGTEFHAYCAGVLAQVNGTSLQVGMGRVGDIVNNMEKAAAASGGLLKIAFVRYTAAGNPNGKFNSADMPLLIGALQTAGIVTTQEGAALVSSWPMVQQ